jgi:hypothetical protein
MKESEADIGQIILNFDLPGIHTNRIEVFRAAKLFGADDINLDCSLVVEEAYKLMFKDVPVFHEYNYCNSCRQKFALWNLVTVYPSNLSSDLQSELESFQFQCACGNVVNKAIRNTITIAPRAIDFNAVELPLEGKIEKIPRDFQVFGEKYHVKAIISLKESHYTALCLDPITQRYHSFDCLKDKPSLVPKSQKVSVALLILSRV